MFDFLKRKKKNVESENKLGNVVPNKGFENDSEILGPKKCTKEIPNEIALAIERINWSSFCTAYGKAENTIPNYLKDLFSSDIAVAMDAAHQLWCSLCHQHVFISNAALPSYDILKIALLTLDDEIKVELLDIFLGFTVCTDPAVLRPGLEIWERTLRDCLISDIETFRNFSASPNEDISYFAREIVKSLERNIDSR